MQSFFSYLTHCLLCFIINKKIKNNNNDIIIFNETITKKIKTYKFILNQNKLIY